MSLGLWPGRKATSKVRSRSSTRSPSRSTRVTSTRAPQARKARETDWSAAVTSSEIPWRSITSRAKSSSACGLDREVLHERHGGLDRRHLGAGVRGHERRRARDGRCAGG